VKPIKQSQQVVKEAELVVANQGENTIQVLKKRVFALVQVPRWMKHQGLEEYWNGQRQDRIVKCWVRRVELDLRAIESVFIFSHFSLSINKYLN
jgi:hypothetical protein